MVLSELGTWAVSAIAGGIAGNQAYDKLKDMRQQTRRTFAGTFGAPSDHDIDKAVASAAYQAVMVVLKDYEAAAGHRLAQDFVQVLGVALRDRVTLFRDPWTEPEIPTAARPHLNRLISASGGTPEAVADIGPFLNDVMLDEVTEMVGGIAVPEAFVASMRANEPNGFFPRFRAFIAQELAINDRFHRLFVATRLAEMADGVDVMRGKMERFAREAAESREISGEVHDDVREIKIKMNQAIGNNIIAEQALEMLTREKKQTERAILFFLARVFNENVQPVDVVSFLYERADELAARKTEAVLVLAEAPSNSNNEVDALRRAAAEALLNEDFDRNAELLEQVADLEVTNLRRKEANLAEQIQETERSRVRAVDSLKARIDAQKMRGDPKATADALWALFEVEYPTTISQHDRFEAAIELQVDWYIRGRDLGLNFDLAVSIQVARTVLSLASNSDQRGAAQNNLGVSLQTLGEREISIEFLELAATAYRLALDEFTRERAPLTWAKTQNNLGQTLSALGQLENGSKRLEESVLVHRAALEAITRERAPLVWAISQSNLGVALSILGERENSNERLRQAATAFREALREQTREHVPHDWAATQNNLANVLQKIGERENSAGQLAEAVAAYKFALQERPRERFPLDWAATQNNIGSALHILGKLENDTERLKEAVTAYRAALQERTRERVPLDWAATQNNLGNALTALGVRESCTRWLDEAVDAYRAALREFSSERAPVQWAMTLGNLGITSTILVDRNTNLNGAELAYTQIETAYQNLATAGHASFAAGYLRQRSVTQAVIKKLKLQK